MGKNKHVSCKICFKTLRSDNLKRHMRVHIIYTSPEVQSENSEEICNDIVNDIVDKMFEQEESVIEVSNSTLKRKYCEVGNYTTAKKNDAQDHTDIKRKYKIDYEDLKKKNEKRNR